MIYRATVLFLMVVMSVCASEKFKVYWCEFNECKYMHQFITLDAVAGIMNVQVDADDTWPGLTLIGLGGKILSETKSDSMLTYMIANRDGSESSFNAYGTFGVYRYYASDNGIYSMLLANCVTDSLHFDKSAVNKSTNPCD